MIIFYSCHNLNNWELWDRLFSIVKGSQEEHGIPEEIVGQAISCCQMSILWYLDELDENNPGKGQMKELRKKMNTFMLVCFDLLQNNQDRIQESAYVTICDLLIVFGKQLASNNVLIKPLVYEPDGPMQSLLSTFLNDKVFIDDEDGEFACQLNFII